MTYFVIMIRYTESTHYCILITERGMSMNWKDKWKDAWDEIGNMSLRELFVHTAI